MIEFNQTEEEVIEMEELNDYKDKKLAGKVYVNINQLIKDHHSNTGHRLRLADLGNLMYVNESGDENTKRVKISRKVSEVSAQELTITEVHNICCIFDITITEFFEKYTLAQ